MPKSGQHWDPAFLLGHPLFKFWEPIARNFRQAQWPGPEQFTEELGRFSQQASIDLPPLCFRGSPKKPRRSKRQSIDLCSLYDGSIALSREIPCLKESYHDLFNALVFCAFPRSKRRLHHRQFRAQCAWLEASGALSGGIQLPGKRSREQDALTIFDEGGTVILLSRSGYQNWLGQREPTLLSLGDLREGIPLLFGHALLEHLYDGRTNLRSSGVVLVVEDEEVPPAAQSTEPSPLFDLADRKLAARLDDPSQFLSPGADVIFLLDADGRGRLGPPKPDWHLPHPALPPPQRRPRD